MKSYIIGIVAALALAHTALACDGPQPPNCNCNNTTGQWEVNVNASAGASSQSSSKATGGNATAGVSNSGNSSNKVSNQQTQSLNNSGNNSATATGGAGGNASTGPVTVQSNNANTNNVTGGSSTSSIGAGAGSSSNHVSATTGASTSSATANGNGSGNGNGNEVVYEAAKTYRAPVETAYSANLTSGIDTCLGSFSAGGQTQILGLTFGKTVVDKNCVLIKQTKLLNENGLHRSACFRMQQGKEGDAIRKAMQEAGEACPPMPVADDDVKVPVATFNPDYVTQEQLGEVERRITTKVTSK